MIPYDKAVVLSPLLIRGLALLADCGAGIAENKNDFPIRVCRSYCFHLGPVRGWEKALCFDYALGFLIDEVRQICSVFRLCVWEFAGFILVGIAEDFSDFLFQIVAIARCCHATSYVAGIAFVSVLF